MHKINKVSNYRKLGHDISAELVLGVVYVEVLVRN